MKSVTMPLGRSLEYVPRNPERTARRSLPGIFGEIEFKEWTNRPAMARSIRMQEKGESGACGKWKACVPLSPGEGY